MANTSEKLSHSMCFCHFLDNYMQFEQIIINYSIDPSSLEYQFPGKIVNDGNFYYIINGLWCGWQAPINGFSLAAKSKIKTLNTEKNEMIQQSYEICSSKV